MRPLSCSLLLFVFHRFFLDASFAAAGAVAVEYLYPNYTASSLLFIDTGGVFLESRNAVFQAAVYNPGAQQSRFYFSVLHAASGTAVWTANRAAPLPDRSGLVSLTPLGLAVTNSNGSLLWSTPPLSAPAAALGLLDSGDLVLLDARNASLWRSFDDPADALVSDQPLRAGSHLSSSVSDTDFAEGAYNLTVTPSDAALAWGGAQYWSLSGDVRSAKDRNAPVAYMAANASGLYLYAADAGVVFAVPLPPAPLRIIKLGPDGAIRVASYAAPNASAALGGEFVAPSGPCDLPLACGPLGLCSAPGNASNCACPPLFAASNNGGCEPANGPPLFSSSNCTTDNSKLSYLALGTGIDYFANKYAAPTTSGGDPAACRSRCSGNCSCLGYYYDNTSESCHLLESRQLGSLFLTSTSEESNALGYIKAIQGSPTNTRTHGGNSSSSTNFVAILLPSIAAFLLVVVFASMGILWWLSRRKKRMRRSKSPAAAKEFQLRWQKSPVKNSDDLDSDMDEDESDDVFIPGLPTRFAYAELEEVTDNFRTKIGSGGFGAVFKGELPDKTLVAVKRIDAVGLQRKREFCTEIAVIGNIHHVNLVRLRGFCAQGSRRLLVYEYMNRGSLDRSLFGSTGPVLEWGERMEVAIGAARGLAYLHSGCEHKIVHCDVKPENILLADGGQVKIADFGLAKLMGPDQSGFFTTMRGTRGYLAPEWLTNAAISDRTDVYSFGMVLLELVRGRKNRTDHVSDGDSREWSSGLSWGGGGGGGGEYFPMVALERHVERRYRELADPRLEGRVREEEVERVVKVALCCLHEEPALRPSMSAVAGTLDGTMDASEPRVASLNFLRLYGRGFVGGASAIVGAANELFGGGAAAYNLARSVASATTTTTTSGSPSYMSSQQVSGPR